MCRKGVILHPFFCYTMFNVTIIKYFRIIIVTTITTTMKTIIVMYWHGKLKDLPYEHGQEFDCNDVNRNEIIKTCIDLGYSTMLRPYDLSLIIWIVKGSFTQH